MDLSPFGVRASAGTLRAAEDADSVVLRHVWTEEGVVAGPAANGAQVLHLSVALCVLNDTYREAERLGVEVRGVAVEVDGGFDERLALDRDRATASRSTRRRPPRTRRAWPPSWTRSRRSRGHSVPARSWHDAPDASLHAEASL